MQEQVADDKHECTDASQLMDSVWAAARLSQINQQTLYTNITNGNKSRVTTHQSSMRSRLMCDLHIQTVGRNAGLAFDLISECIP